MCESTSVRRTKVPGGAVRKLVQKTGTERPFDQVGKEYTLGVLKKVNAATTCCALTSTRLRS